MLLDAGFLGHDGVRDCLVWHLLLSDRKIAWRGETLYRRRNRLALRRIHGIRGSEAAVALTGCRAESHFISARFFQKFSRLSVPPKSVVKCVESISRMSPARSPSAASRASS